MFVLPFALYFGLQGDKTHPPRVLLPQIKNGAAITSYASINADFIYKLKTIMPKCTDIEDVKQVMKASPKGYVISRKRYQTELEEIEGLYYVDEAKDTFENPTSLLMGWGN